jgi:glutamate-ammonia-ligase adenylyltransferase
LNSPGKAEPLSIPAHIEFRDPAAAARHLNQVRALLRPEAYDPLLNILSSSPDSDSTLLLLCRLLESLPPNSGPGIETDTTLLHHVCTLFAHSSWLGETLIQNPDMLSRLVDRGELRRSLSKEEFRSEFARLRMRRIGAAPSLLMARFRKREYVRILLRDMLRIAELAEITAEVSALADALLEEALAEANAELVRRYGSPKSPGSRGEVRAAEFAVVSLGKLGGNELNYSSDVDLMFLYDGGREPGTARISNREYFIQLAQNVTEMLSRRTREGQTFRIDLRLRPLGHEGEVAVALPRAVQYYSEVAEDWELQAMIKARHSAGDSRLTREFVRAIASCVYRPNVNFAAVKTALQTRERIDRRGRDGIAGWTERRAINVKLDRGGIRDIEFLVQCLQRLYGGDESWLRSRGTLFALQKLHDKEHISGKDFHSLTKAYEFLRNLEHHLQLRHGQQSHTLPGDSNEVKVLARCVMRPDRAPRSAEEFVAHVQSRMAAVGEIYRRVVYREQSHQTVEGEAHSQLRWETAATPENSYSQMMQRLAVDAPQLLAKLARAEMSQHGRRNLERFFNSASTSPERYGAILRSPEAVEKAVTIFNCSEYLSGLLVRYPSDAELLTNLDERAPEGGVVGESAADRLEALGRLRNEFRRSMVLANSKGLYQPQEIWEVLRENSRAADSAVKNALVIAKLPESLAVMALGRLGSSEFDLLSDADLLFVADSGADLEACQKAAERVMDSLTAYTRDGTVFPVDTRLRPRGSAGELVTTPERLARYFASEAQPWEAVTYLRLRQIAGSEAVGQRAIEVTREGIASMACRDGFGRELGDMREKLEASGPRPNVKTGPGGTYDIDFLIGRLQVRHGVWCNGNLAERVRHLRQAGLIESEDSDVLAGIAGFMRTLEHCIRLVTGHSHKWLPASEHARANVAKLMGAAGTHVLETELTSKMRQTRDLYRKYCF